MRFLIANPTASLYNNRTQILAALEFACLDLLGQAWGVPVCDILGGRLRDRRSALHEVLAQLEYPAGQAQVWRYAVSNWFLRESGISDKSGRVGHYPGRVEAGSMKLDGYVVRDVASATTARQVGASSTSIKTTASRDFDSGWRISLSMSGPWTIISRHVKLMHPDRRAG